MPLIISAPAGRSSAQGRPGGGAQCVWEGEGGRRGAMMSQTVMAAVAAMADLSATLHLRLSVRATVQPPSDAGVCSAHVLLPSSF